MKDTFEQALDHYVGENAVGNIEKNMVITAALGLYFTLKAAGQTEKTFEKLELEIILEERAQWGKSILMPIIESLFKRYHTVGLQQIQNYIINVKFDSEINDALHRLRVQ